MSIEKEFVPYQESLELKELGFDEPCVYYVDKDNNSYIYNFQTHPDEFIEGCGVNVIPTPTLSQVFRWFRQKGYDIKVQKESKGSYFGFYWTGASWVTVGAGSYEEAEQACLDELIKIVKTNETLH